MKLSKKIFVIFIVFIMLMALSLGLLPSKKEVVTTTAEETSFDISTSIEKGGAIYLAPGAVYTMTDGIISGHSALKGGAIYISNGSTFTMKGGSITQNTAVYGGAIYVAHGGKLILEGGSIEGNLGQYGLYNGAIYFEGQDEQLGEEEPEGLTPEEAIEEGALEIQDEIVNVENNEITRLVTKINVYVDDVFSKSLEISGTTYSVDESKMPLSNEECCGYFSDSELLNSLYDKAVDISSVKVMNVYTKSAVETLNKGVLTFEKISESSYSVKASSTEITGEVVIPAKYNGLPITAIGDSAFNNCNQITNIILPAKLEIIEDYAFKSSSITNLNINSEIKNIGIGITSYCGSLLSIVVSDDNNSYNVYSNYNSSNSVINTNNILIAASNQSVVPNGVLRIEKEAFSGLTGLTEIEIPKSIIEIRDNAFEGCEALSDIYIDSKLAWCNIDFTNRYSNPMWGATNFYINDTLVQDFDIPTGIKTIKPYTITGNSILRVVLNSDLVEIGAKAFEGASALSTVEIVESVTTIGENAFKDCTSMNYIYIPENVLSINGLEAETSPFWGCTNLTIYVEIDGTDYTPSVIGYSFLEHWNNYDETNRCTTLWAQTYLGYLQNMYSDFTFSVDETTGDITAESYVGSGGDVVIPQIVDNLAASIFSGNSTIESVTMYANLKSVGEKAFYSVSALSDVTYIGTIEDWCNIEFAKWSASSTPLYSAENITINNEKNPTDLVIPASVSVIGGSQFYGWTFVENIYMSEGIEAVGYESFSGMNNVKNFYYEGSWESWCNISFMEGVSSTAPNDNPLYFSENTYFNGELIAGGILELPNTVTKINNYALGGLDVEFLVLPDSVTAIGDGAFARSGIKFIYIPKTVLTIPGSVSSWNNSQGVLEYHEYTPFSSCSEDLRIFCEVDGEGSSPVDTETYNWSSNWNALGGETINQYLTYWNVSYDAFMYSAQYTDFAFSGGEEDGYCIEDYFGDESVICPSEVNIKGIGKYAFFETNITSIDLSGIKTIGAYAFQGCTGITEAIMDSIVTIGEYAFESCTGLKHVSLSNYTKSVGDYAFSGCNNISYLNISGDGVSLGAYSFNMTTNLSKEIHFGNVSYIGDMALSETQILHLHIDDLAAWCTKTLVNADTYNFTYKTLFIEGSVAKNLIIPEGVEYISDYAFYGFSQIESVIMPSSVLSVGAYAFSSCSDLKQVFFKDCVAKIGLYAFSSSALETIDFGNFVYEIGDYAFHNIVSLNTVYIPANIKTIGSFAFYLGNESLIIYIELESSLINLENGYSYDYSWIRYNYDSNYALYTTHTTKYGVSRELYELMSRYPDYIFSGDSTTGYCVDEYIGDSKYAEIPGEENIVTIGKNAFSNKTTLLSVIIPKSVVSITNTSSYSPFYGCTKLTIYCEAAQGAYVYTPEDGYNYASGWNRVSGSVDAPVIWWGNAENTEILEMHKKYPDYIFAGSTSTGFTIEKYIGDGGAVSIPSDIDIVAIGKLAFSARNDITYICIPANIKTIIATSVTTAPFYSCSGMIICMEIAGDGSTPTNTTEYSFGEYWDYYNSGLKLKVAWQSVFANDFILGKESDGSYAIYKYLGLGGNVVIPDDMNITKINDGVFTSTTRNAFSSLTIPASVKYIGGYSGTPNHMTSLYLPSPEEWAMVEIASEYTIQLFRTHNIYFDGVLYDGSIVIENADEIKSYVFNVLKYANYINIDVYVKNVGTINSHMFFDMTSSYKVNLHLQNVNRICASAIYELLTINLFIEGNDDEMIFEAGVIDTCTNISALHINSLSGWCNIAFASDAANPMSLFTSVYFNGETKTSLDFTGIKEIKSYAFYGYSALTRINLASVESIGELAFVSTGLTGNVVIPNTITTITASSYSKAPFYGCSEIYFYCMFSEKPEGWDTYWNRWTSGNSFTTYWNASDESVALTIKYPDYRFTGNSIDGFTITKYMGEGGDVIVPKGENIVTIGASAFANIKTLRKVTLPDGLTTIENLAFQNCDYFDYLYIPSSVNTIEATSYETSPFYGCSYGLFIYTSKSKTANDWNLYSFALNSDGTGAIVHYDMQLSEDNNFLYYEISEDNPTKVYDYNTRTQSTTDFYSITEGLYLARYIGNDTIITIPGIFSVIGYNAFLDQTSIEEVKIEYGVKHVASNAFEGCENLKKINIPNSVLSINEMAFSGCYNLRKVFIPSSVLYMGQGSNAVRGVFETCNEVLILIECSEIPDTWDMSWKYTRDDDGNSILHVDNIFYGIDEICGELNIEYIDYKFVRDVEGDIEVSQVLNLLEADVVIINDYRFNTLGCGLFENNKEITSVTISSNIKKIKTNAFKNCINLENVYVDSWETWCNIEFDSYFSNPMAYAKNLYVAGNLITDVVLPSSVTKINDFAFYNFKAMKSIYIPNSVTSIGSSAFENCTGLTQIFIPNSVKEIKAGSLAASPFYGCENLTIYCETDGSGNVPSSTDYQYDECWNFYAKNGELSVVWNAVDNTRTLTIASSLNTEMNTYSLGDIILDEKKIILPKKVAVSK